VSLIPALSIVVGVLVLALLGHVAGYLVAGQRTHGRGRIVAESFVRNTRWPSRVLLPLCAAEVAVAVVALPSRLHSGLLQGIGIALMLAAVWLAVGLFSVLEDALLARYRLDATETLRGRQLETQVHVLRRITVVVAAVVAIGGVLLTFGPVRAAGAGLLASAGVVGVIIGLGATPLINNLIAGLQIGVAQPIRLDDVVVIYNTTGTSYWGRIEEIHLTYVVVKVWDLKRLMVPISYLTQNPFEVWTRNNATVMGYVYIVVDYTMPVQALRDHLTEVVKASPDWDGDVWTLQVTDLSNETVQLRALMSSPDSNASWNLQVEVREKALTFLQENYPWALPRVRTEVGWAEGDGQLRRGASTAGHPGRTRSAGHPG
jgi:small-conductance mechanosensitive channel